MLDQLFESNQVLCGMQGRLILLKGADAMAMEDKIGRQEFVGKICGLVDSLKKDNHTCIAINGDWGSGKSFVLGMIEEQLSQKAENIVIKYDAWENSFYSDPLIAILSCIIDGIEDESHLSFGKENIKNAAKAVIDTGAELSPKIKKLRIVIQGLINAIKSFQCQIDTTNLAEFKSYKKLLNETKELLDKITLSEDGGSQSKLIILVDEIDRCLPDVQLKILERFHHLFDVKNCAVIVTMNQNSVAQTVRTIYGVDGYEYLQKFFDFTFSLRTSANEYFRNLLDDYVNALTKIGVPKDQAEIPTKLAYQCLLYGNKRVLDKADNREITRYYDGVMNVCNDFGWEKMKNPYYIFFVLVALYIRRIIAPSFLDAEDVLSNQVERSEDFMNLSQEEQKINMPYVDYLLEYLGLDRYNPPEEFQQLYRWGGRGVAKYSWTFNETIYYSLSKDIPNNELRRFHGQPTVNPEDCKKLCKLIVLYGGEQQNRMMKK